MSTGKKILCAIGIIVALTIVAILGIAATKPDDYKYERTIVIDAPAAAVYAQVANLSNWEHWSPWAKLDTDAKMSLEGPAMDKGAIMRWDGNAKVGKGSLEITDAQHYTQVTYHLVFEKPMKGQSDSTMTFEATSPKLTKVVWSMYGTQNYFEKVIGTAMNCEKIMNKTFDQGLTNLKNYLETKA